MSMSFFRTETKQKPTLSNLDVYWVVDMNDPIGYRKIRVYGFKKEHNTVAHMLNTMKCTGGYEKLEFENCINPQKDQDDARNNG